MNEKYPYNTGYLHIPLELVVEQMPTVVAIGGEGLEIKDEFHISLVCVRDMIASHGEEIERKVLDLFYEFAENNVVEFKGFTGEYRLAERNRDDEHRMTVVGMCTVSNLDKFYDELNQELGTAFDSQPTHVTLYTLGHNKGIGINNKKSLEEMTEDRTQEVLEKYPELKTISLA